MGVHVVVIAWMSVVELRLTSDQLGWVQASVLLPTLLLMLVAGAWADRFDPAKLLSGAQLLLTLSYVGLWLVVVQERGGFLSLVLYAVAVGVGNAFVQPVREKLITELKKGSAQRRISILSITQFSLQSAGIGLAALTEAIGLDVVIAIQACVSALSSMVYMTLTREQPVGSRSVTDTLEDIRRALVYITDSAGLRQLMTLIAFNGYMHLGVFLVAVPLMATRTYNFSSSEYAGLQLLFVLGMITAHSVLLTKKTVEYPGQGALFSLLYTALIGFGLAQGPTPFGFYSLVFLWGLVAGNSAGRCRLVLQSLVVPEMKGRVMSVYQLLLFGAAPLGALVTGYVLNHMEIYQIFGFMSFSSVAIFSVFLLTRTLWSVKQHDT